MQAQIAAWFDTALWYWIAAALLWWHVCSQTLGVPNGLLTAAAREPEAAETFDRLARRSAAAVADAARRWGWIAAALSAFAVMFAGVHAFASRSPSAAGAFCLLAPLVWLLWVSARTAQALDGAQPDAQAVRLAFARLRMRAFGAALASVALAGMIRGAARVSALG